MKKDLILRIYAYAVCAILLFVGLIFVIEGTGGIVKIAAPALTMNQRDWAPIASFQSFKTDWEKTEGAPELTDDELRVRWQDKRQVALMTEKRRGGQSLIHMLIGFVWLTPLFIIHWRLARRLRPE